MKMRAMLLNVLLLGAALALPPMVGAAEQSLATAGAGGVYPAGTTFANIDVRGIQLGFGAEVNPDASGLGNFTAVLLGVSALGLEQRIVIEGYVTGGTRPGANVAVLTGTSTIDLGDGTPATPDIPFTATLTSNPTTALGSVALVLDGLANLPAANLNAGSLIIKTVTVN